MSGLGHFPSIIEQLERKIRKSKADEQFLVTISREKDLVSVSLWSQEVLPHAVFFYGFF